MKWLMVVDEAGVLSVSLLSASIGTQRERDSEIKKSGLRSHLMTNRSRLCKTHTQCPNLTVFDSSK